MVIRQDVYSCEFMVSEIGIFMLRLLGIEGRKIRFVSNNYKSIPLHAAYGYIIETV